MEQKQNDYCSSCLNFDLVCVGGKSEGECPNYTVYDDPPEPGAMRVVDPIEDSSLYIQEYVKRYATVIIINGYPRSGKDTFIKYCDHILHHRCQSSTIISSIDEIERIAHELGWDGKKDSKGRAFLADLKALSIGYYNFPFNFMKEKIVKCKTDYMFINVREPEEIKKFVDTFGAITVFIHGQWADYRLSNDADRNVEAYAYDHYINNHSTLDELHAWASRFCSLLEDIRKR